MWVALPLPLIRNYAPFSDRHNLQTLSELNITPLLDLAFVLLIIFMITTPLMEKSVDLVLPSSEAAPNAVDPKAVQTIAISREAEIRLNTEPIPLVALEGELTQLKQENSGVAVVIRSHKELPVQRLIEVMDAVQRAKISKVGVVTQPETRSEGRCLTSGTEGIAAAGSVFPARRVSSYAPKTTGWRRD